MKYLISLLLFFFTFLNAKDVSVDEMISQMIIVGFSGEMQEDKWVKQIQNDIETHRIGGIVYASKNIKNSKQLKALNSYLQKSNPSKIPLFFALEQEGGDFQKLDKDKGFVNYLDAFGVAKDKSLQEAYAQYEILSREIASYGFNLNFAPVLDLNTKEEIQNKRNYSSEEEIVIAYANTFIDAMQKHKILFSLKHFPGLGNGEKSTNQLVNASKTWTYKELKPYYHFIKAQKADMIMVGHIKLDLFDSVYPSSMSKNVIDKVLRQKFGYEGVVISDDMLNKEILEIYGLENAIIKSIQAGTDILLFSSYFYNNSNIPKIVHEVINKAIKKGEINENMVKKAYERVVKLKNKLKKEES